MKTYDAQQAAALLHLDVKRVQALAREGKLPAHRVGRKWLFPQDRIEALLGGRPGGGDRSLAISARNRLRGTITRLLVDGLMAEVHLSIGGQTLVSVITRSSAEALRLEVGQDACAVIKSTEVMIGKEAKDA